ncbi:MAG: hypothetical protein M1821_007496 [Bathelium mastoideum]|nr:MAG: hypothetical protein M1821_007496 [Bathelium mastoideum]
MGFVEYPGMHPAYRSRNPEHHPDQNEFRGKTHPPIPNISDINNRVAQMDLSPSTGAYRAQVTSQNLRSLKANDGAKLSFPKPAKSTSSSKKAKKSSTKFTNGKTQKGPSTTKSKFRIKLQFRLPQLKNIARFRLPTKRSHQEDLSTKSRSPLIGKTSEHVEQVLAKEDKKPGPPSCKSQGHHRETSSSTVSTSATKTRSSHKRNKSGSTQASSIQKPLPTIPGDYFSTVLKERPVSSIYSPSNDYFALPAIREERSSSRIEPFLRPESNIVLLMQDENPFKGELKLDEPTITELPEQDNSKLSPHVHFKDHASVVSAPAELESPYRDEPGSISTVRPSSPLRPVRKDSLPNITTSEDPHASLPNAYLALQRENASLRTSVATLTSLQNEISSRVPPAIAALEADNSELRAALAAAHHHATALSDSVSELVTRSPSTSVVSLVPAGASATAPNTPTQQQHPFPRRSITASSTITRSNSNSNSSTTNVSRKASSTTSSSATLLSDLKNIHPLLRSPHLQPHTPPPSSLPLLPPPPRIASLRLPPVDRLLHPAAKAQYYARTDARQPETARLAAALAAQEADLRGHREGLRRARTTVAAAEADMEAGIREVARAKRMVGVGAEKGLVGKIGEGWI